MPTPSQKTIPTKINLDLAPEYFDGNTARFIKNLTSYVGTTNENGNLTEGKNTGKLKPHQSNELYVNVGLPEVNNQKCGSFSSAETNEVFVCIYNDNKEHLIYRINGNSRTYDIVYKGAELNFKLNPENFIAVGNAWLEVIYLTDPLTGEKIRRTFFMFTDAVNYQRQIAVEDSIATNSFDKSLYPYFNGDYDKELLINMGLSTPKTCIKITEIKRTQEDYGLINNLLFNTWQFRITDIDVWGRPSEHSIISDLYVPGINDCFSASPNLPRCLNLNFDAGSPIVDKKQIEYRNCNDPQWYLDSVINLYDGSSIGDWWLRSRNPDINYNASDNTIDYTFCRNREKNAIPQTETARLFNPLPRQSQALTKVADVISLFNNKDGFIPFSKEVKNGITITVEPPDKTAIIESRTITIYVPIYNRHSNNYQTVSKNATYGYMWGDGNEDPPNQFQYFKNKQQSGFIGYLLGSGSVAISTQSYVTASGTLVEDPEFNAWQVTDKKITFEKFVFYGVPKGVYIFRLASHLSDIAAGDDFQKTSTTVWGKCPFSPSNYNVDVLNRAYSQELIIDVCEKDYSTLTSNEILVIADLAYHDSRSQCGYIYETDVNGYNENPMELVALYNPVGANSQITDHNGFYWFTSGETGRTFQFNFMYKCVSDGFTQETPSKGMQFVNEILSNGVDNNHKWLDYFTTACNRVLIKGRITLSGSDIGVPNVAVVLTRGQSAITDDNGNYTIIAHDNNKKTGSIALRHDEIIINGGTCNYTSTTGDCITPIQITFSQCAACRERIINVSDTIVQYLSQHSLLSGGTYGIGVVGWDWLGRATFVQDLKFITIPTIIQSQTIGASKVLININPNTIFPTEFDYLTFFITEELTIEDYITWIVDRFEFVDNSGNINDISPTQIKIYYGSLNEYNKNNNFNTTTSWQFIAPVAQGSTTQLPYESDVVQFYLNGDGKFFDKLITALVKYDSEGQYFLIDYTDDLKGLVQNALIRLVRPKNISSEQEPYYEICHIVELENGVPQENKFYLNAFDTYYLNRQIPVPIPVTPTPTVTQTATVNGNVTTYTTPVAAPAAIELRVFGFPFEHDSPSNFWGKGCKNIGRVNIKNPYETEVFSLNQSALSGKLSKTGQLNYLNYFDDAEKTTFNIPNVGGITAGLYEMGIVAILCQYDNFVVGYNDNLVRVVNGNIQVPSADTKFGKPERKIGNNYGCQFYDKNTIQKRNGLISFVDSNKGELVQFNYSDILSYTKGQCDSWFRKKVKIIQANKGDKYFISGIDPITNNYLLSDFSLKNKSYINALRDVSPNDSETVSFDMGTRELKDFWSYVGEGYECLDGDLLNVQFFSFKKGQPYSHYNINTNNSYSKFFDVQCEKVFRSIFNLGADTKKMFLGIAAYCQNENYFSDSIKTDSKQDSRLLLAAWNKGDYFYFAPFQCDLNTIPDNNLPDETGINKIFDGDKLYGNYIDVRLVGEPDKIEQYSELLDVRIFAFPNSNTGDT